MTHVDVDVDEVLLQGVRGYARSVTDALGLRGECSYVQVERPVTAYLAVDGRLPGFPDRDTALLWDEDRGWSAAVETHSGEDLLVVAHLEGDVLPPPAVVAEWARSLFRGDRRVPPARPAGAGELAHRLGAYVGGMSVPEPRRA
ncbi:DUF6292 family protein [Saccharothrix syringae]|uniref:DUF6292 domain-containing protein n=1 Tax=Saccharothrix syringae TaxID=103733 RepID=A0A5Q0GUR2_SACSY|nr:DUF6292 family protein [Saccharothrix syringae]QFZ17846.1 hypothetical protein EKG83_10450 [Saccharothrix syringae]